MSQVIVQSPPGRFWQVRKTTLALMPNQTAWDIRKIVLSTGSKPKPLRRWQDAHWRYKWRTREQTKPTSIGSYYPLVKEDKLALC